MRTTLMTNERAGATHRRFLLGAALLMAVALAVPQRAEAAAEADYKKCFDDAWAEYNSCLLDAATKFQRLTCDIFFEADAVICGAKFVGVVTKEAAGIPGVS